MPYPVAGGKVASKVEKDRVPYPVAGGKVASKVSLIFLHHQT